MSEPIVIQDGRGGATQTPLSQVDDQTLLALVRAGSVEAARVWRERRQSRAA